MLFWGLEEVSESMLSPEFQDVWRSEWGVDAIDRLGAEVRKFFQVLDENLNPNLS
jgi:hypothetical protein